MGVSIAKFNTATKANHGIEVELLDLATGEGSGAFISVHGTDSKAFKTVVIERGE